MVNLIGMKIAQRQVDVTDGRVDPAYSGRTLTRSRWYTAQEHIVMMTIIITIIIFLPWVDMIWRKFENKIILYNSI